MIGAVTYFLFRCSGAPRCASANCHGAAISPAQRVGTHWVYDELQDGVIESIELPLDYVGRGEYDIHIPGRTRLAQPHAGVGA